ncbi:MAG: alpha/beta hydrolase fold domain-containing protein [Rhizobiales bacterium]|nr:alpha/beta hydrolase fold domain-containing protein [Hyphomicrobiales bacterium]
MSLQKFILRLMMMLPGRWLVKLSGRPPIEIDGRVMDPRAQFIAAQGARGPNVNDMTVEQMRDLSNAGLAMLDAAPRPDVTITDMSIPGPTGRIPARRYAPSQASGALPGLIYFHMGGCVIGNLETCHSFCTMLSEIAGCVVLSVDYRMAPEHKFPAAVDDAITAFRWAKANAVTLGMLPGNIAVGGDSAGGYLSAVVSQTMKAAGEQGPSVQLLIYPMTDLEATGGSMESCAEVYPLTKDVMDWFMGHYLNSPEEGKDTRVSVMKASDLSGLPRAIVATAGFDPLRDQGAAYADRLREAGVPVTYHCYDTQVHAFTAMGGMIPAARQACEELATDLATALRVKA